MTENTREVENILILGNGFDLAMGRKTSYTDFLEFVKLNHIILNLDMIFFPINIQNAFEVIDKELDIDKVVGKINNIVETYWGNNQDFNLACFNYLFLSEEPNRIFKFFEDDFLNFIEKYNQNRQDIDSRFNDTFSKKLSIFKNVDFEVIRAYFDEYPKGFSEKNFDSLLQRLEYDLQNFDKEAHKQILTQYYENKPVFGKYDSSTLKKLNPSLPNKINNAGRIVPYKFDFDYFNNYYTNFIFENKNTLGKNWSSLELIISDLANSLKDIKKNVNVYKKYLNSEVEISSSDFISEFNPTAYAYILEKLREKTSEEKTLQSVIDELNEKLVKDLEDLTDWLEFYFTYLYNLEKIEKQKTAYKKDIEKRKKEIVLTEILNTQDRIEKCKVINFNYTDRINRFWFKKDNIHFIHGRLNFDRNLKPKINQMVFGIEDKEEDVNTDLIPYQKFYQRVVKETGNDYEEFFKTKNDKLVLVFGHSVDPLDKEIFQNCFRLLGDYVEKGEEPIDDKDKVNYRFIFAYYNEESKRSIAKNLAIILGKNRFVTLTGQKKIQFVQNNDRKKMREIWLEWRI